MNTSQHQTIQYQTTRFLFVAPRSTRQRCPLLILTLVLFAFGSLSSVALAQESNTNDTAATGAPEDISADEVNTVAREIWCPLCSGVRLDACELKACAQMKDVIAIKLSEGEDTVSIKNYFVEQYGPQILGEPPREGFNWLAWILPFAALLGGGVFLWNKTRGLVRPVSSSEPDRDTDGSVAMSVATEKTADAAMDEDRDETVDKSADEYERKLEEELANYG